MLKQVPKVGDKVILKGVVTAVDIAGTFRMDFVDCPGAGASYVSFSPNRIHELISAPPPVPKVGDRVICKARPNMYEGSSIYCPVTLIHIHHAVGDVREWGVIAFKGDIPRSVYLEDLEIAP